MSNFHPFALAVHRRYNELAKGELFVVDAGELAEHYLAAFLPGTNPIFRTNTEHDCSCCRNFIRHLGNVVSIEGGVVRTVWDDAMNDSALADEYRVVARRLSSLVRAAPIKTIFRSSEKQYGAEFTLEQLDDGKVRRWNHFHGKVAAKHLTATPDKARGDFNMGVQTFTRALTELRADAIAQVLELIDDKLLYRGEEHKAAVVAFQKAHTEYHALKDADARTLYVLNAVAGKDARSHFRNSVIGTLVTDLSEGMDLDQAVRSFEVKVAPENYKRPTALITPAMVASAMKTIESLGLESALERRLARMSDITVNNVLWVDGGSKADMNASGIGGLLMKVAKANVKTKALAGSNAISADDFLNDVLPHAAAVELVVRNRHQGNFVTMTAPVHADAPRLFKWDNGFAWSYKGNIADSEIRKAVAARGGKVDGVFRFSHQWNHPGRRNASLMDLHVFMPGNSTGGKKGGGHSGPAYGTGRRIGWNRRSDPQSGGVQDVDYTQAAPVGYVPVENITFPDLAKMPEGEYRCMIHNWQHRAPTESGFKAEIEFAGQVFEYDYPKPLKYEEWVPVATVTLRAGQFSIKHHLPSSASTQEVWGVQTEQPVKVKTVLQSPNHWDGQQTGNRHLFFILDGCKADEPARGVYNEFLRGDLDQHRKVFETLGAQTKCPVVDDQLSGLGFSSTKGNTAEVIVTTAAGRQNYTINF